MVGSILLTLALISSIICMVMYYFSIKGSSNTLNIARISYHAMAVFVISAATLFLQAILTHQYQYKYVYDYSGSGLPFGLLISTFYAGQEGSFFLWTLLTIIIGLILQQYSSKRGDLEPRVMFVFTLAASFLLMMISPLLKNPFAYIWTEPTYVSVKNISPAFLNLPFIQSYLFSDNTNGQAFIKVSRELYSALLSGGISINEFIIQGKGLNPLLQNFWMQIHPPMLFTGFSLSTVPFAFAVSALIKNDYRTWIKHAFPWILSAAMVLGCAIMLGGYWAYGVLGWGGYWGWDPVENSSLVPWLVAVASIHTLLVQKKSINKKDNEGTGEFAKTNLVLCMMVYILVLYSTFLTRSGILGDASVHSFTDPGRSVYLFLIVFMSSFALFGLGMMAYRWKYLSAATQEYTSLLNRELALFTGSVAIGACALIVVVGTSAPIIGTSVETKFYSSFNLPIAIIIGFLNGFSLLLKWKQTDGREVISKFKMPVLLSLALSILITGFLLITKTKSGTVSLMMVLLTISASFALVVNAEIAYRIIRGNKKMLGAYIAHMGIAVFLLGVVGTGAFSKQESIELPKDEPKQAFGYTLTYKDTTAIENGKKYAFKIEISKNNSSSIVSPIMFVSDFNNSLMREPDIMSEMTKDFYVAPVSYDPGSQTNSAGSEIALNKGDSKTVDGVKITFTSFDLPKDAIASMQSGGSVKIGAKLQLDYNGQTKEIEPAVRMEKGQRTTEPVEVEDANLKVEIKNLSASGNVELILSKINNESSAPVVHKDVLVIEASLKPFIKLVWFGVLITVAGFFVAVLRRSKESLV
jgi:cytochrome c-type biogenesis protein CcmF